MMTRKDYVLLAKTIRTRVDAIENDSENVGWAPVDKVLMRHALYSLALDLSINLAVQSPKFDRSVFMVAAGFQAKAA